MKIEHKSKNPFEWCQNCGCKVSNYFVIYLPPIIGWGGLSILLCQSCLHKLHSASAPLQVLVTTGQNTKP